MCMRVFVCVHEIYCERLSAQPFEYAFIGGQLIFRPWPMAVLVCICESLHML